MITEDYVSFEVAKLLKEKGFDEVCIGFYTSQKELHLTLLEETNSMWLDNSISAPTLQMVMKWLREKYSLEIYPYHNNSTIYNSKWWFEIVEYPNSVAEYESGKDEEFDTYEETCEAAIKYCLENLI